MSSDPGDQIDTDALIQRAANGDQRALEELFTQHTERLRRMVHLRLNRRLQGRIDPSDVIQEAYLEVSQHLADYAKVPNLPFFLWLRHITGQKLITVHRRHLGAQMRDADMEVSLYRGAFPQASSISLAEHLLGRLTTVSQAAMRAEMQIRVQESLNSMDPIDREVLALRHFELLSNSETATVLGLSKTAASNRYVRALGRLREILEKIPGFVAEL
jgi:RNA polymerase sigma-70 factor (ECF subfamily)